MLKNIIFDFDGTIADSFQIFLEEMPKILARRRIAIPENYSEFIIRNVDVREYVRGHRSGGILTRYLLRTEGSMQREQFRRMNDVIIYNGIPQLLEELNKNGYQLYIVSTNTQKFVNVFLEKHGLGKYFKASYAKGTFFGKEKVLKDFFRKYKLNKKESIYIADEDRDIKACKGIGLRIISVTWGYKSYEFLSKYEPDHIVKTVKDLEKLLLEKLSQ